MNGWEQPNVKRTMNFGEKQHFLFIPFHHGHVHHHHHQCNLIDSYHGIPVRSMAVSLICCLCCRSSSSTSWSLWIVLYSMSTQCDYAAKHNDRLRFKFLVPTCVRTTCDQIFGASITAIGFSFRTYKLIGGYGFGKHIGTFSTCRIF